MINRFNTIMSKTPLLLKVVSLYVIVGIPLYIVLAPSFVPPKAYAYTPPKAAVQVVTPKKQVISGNPVEIRIPSLGITLPIINGYYSAATDTWSLTSDKAQFVTTTALPNDSKGDTFIYGHNTVRVFEPTKAITTDDMAYITTDNGHVFQYQYTGDSFVAPTTTSVLSTDPATPKLTLMTCNGILSETRRLLYFDFKGVS
jgi:LPXTG-site transpeptidase (sortase) family protein